MNISEGSGAVVAADEIAGIKHQRVKIQHGADGSATDVSTASPLPVELSSSQLTTLTPPAAIASIDTKTPALGQALAAASVPVVLPAAQITTLTPPAAITGFATAAKQPALGTAGTASTDVITVQGIASGVAQPVSVATLPDSRESWRVSTLSFTTTDDSDNTFTVPANTEYQVLSVYVSLATTATVGNRQMAVQALDASDNILIGARAGAVQAASLTRVYNFAPGFPQDTAFRDTDYLAVSMPPIFLAAGQKLRVWDKAAVAAAADDMVVRVQIASRSIA